MKCDELKPLVFSINPHDHAVYKATEVDAAIDELKQILQDQCNVRQMCKDVLAKLEDQESVLAEKDKEIAELQEKLDTTEKLLNKALDCISNGKKHMISLARKNNHTNYKRCLAMASKCRLRARWFGDNAFYKKEQWALQWHKRWLELAEQFKEAK